MARFVVSQTVWFRPDRKEKDSTYGIKGPYVIIGKYKREWLGRWRQPLFQDNPKGLWYGLYNGTWEEYCAKHAAQRLEGKDGIKPYDYASSVHLITPEEYAEIQRLQKERQEAAVEAAKRRREALRQILPELMQVFPQGELAVAQFIDDHQYELRESVRMKLEEARKGG